MSQKDDAIKDDEIIEDDELEQDSDEVEEDDQDSDDLDEEELEEESDDDSEEEDSTDDSDEEDDFDYKAALEALQAESANKDEVIERRNRKIQKLKQKLKDRGDEGNGEGDDSKGSSLSEPVLDLIMDNVEEMIDNLTTNPDEKKLILHHFEHTVPPRSYKKKDLQDAVENAYLVTNKHKLKQLEKIKQAKKASDRVASKQTSKGETKTQERLRYTAYDKKMADRHFKGDIKKWLKYKPKE